MAQENYQNGRPSETLSPAQKAWVTRRAVAAAQGLVYAPRRKPAIDTEAIDEVLKEFDQVDGQGMPDYHGIALKMKRLLTETRATTEARRSLATIHPAGSPQAPHGAPLAIPAPDFQDYPVDHVSSWKVESPVILVTFADGRTVRAPAVTAQRKPLNIGRGLRIACHFYQHRVYRQMGFKRGRPSWIVVPPIISCIVEETGATYDAELCSSRTVEARKGNGLRAPHTSFKLSPKLIGGGNVNATPVE